jgi:hypothetical protein
MRGGTGGTGQYQTQVTIPATPVRVPPPPATVPALCLVRVRLRGLTRVVCGSVCFGGAGCLLDCGGPWLGTGGEERLPVGRGA